MQARRAADADPILLTECEFVFEIGDPFRLLGDLFAKPLVLALQPFDLLRWAITRRVCASLAW